MISIWLNRLSNLLCVKSIVTIVLTAVFSYMSIVGRVAGREFVAVFCVVLGVSGGTQSQRLNEKLTGSAADGKQASKDTAQ